MANSETFEELEQQIEGVLDSKSTDFFELATMLDLDPKQDFAGADLSGVNFSGKDLSGANFTGTNFQGADLSNANFEGADLQNANLMAAQVFQTGFKRAQLTGACIADWHISSSTKLEEVKCDYIFCAYDSERHEFTRRLPVDPESNFAPGDFETWIKARKVALETIDITFTEGFDPQAFSQSFQELRNSLPDEDISIQSIERKGNVLVARLKVEEEADRAFIETEIKQRYAQLLAALKRGGTLLAKEVENTTNEIKEAIYNVSRVRFGGGFAAVGDIQHVGKLIDYEQEPENEDIVRLLQALCDLSQAFPEDVKEEVLLELDDLDDLILKREKRNLKRICRRLRALMAVGTASATVAGGAENINEFTENIFELGEKLGLSRVDIEPNQATP